MPTIYTTMVDTTFKPTTNKTINEIIAIIPIATKIFFICIFYFIKQGITDYCSF